MKKHCLPVALSALWWSGSLLAQSDRISTLTGLAAPGFQDGPRPEARFRWPASLAVDADGNVFVADSGNHVIRKITALGATSTFAGAPGLRGSTDGTGTNASFNLPQGLAIDSAGTVYVADSGNHVIRKITSAAVVSTLAGIPGDSGNADGLALTAQFSNPSALAVDGATNVFVADTGNHLIRKISNDGIVSTVAGRVGVPGAIDSTNRVARFRSPGGISVINGDIFVADSGNHIIRMLVTSGTNWISSTIAGFPGLTGGIDGTNRNSRFYEPKGIAADAAGNLYVVDSGNQTIRKVSPGGTNWVVTTVAGVALQNGNSNGAAGSALFHWPSGVAFDVAGHFYVADSGNNGIRVDRTILPQLMTTTARNSLVLSWSILDSGYSLEVATNLAGGWVPLTSGIAIQDQNFVFTNKMAEEALFYRLRSP